VVWWPETADKKLRRPRDKNRNQKKSRAGKKKKKKALKRLWMSFEDLFGAFRPFSTVSKRFRTKKINKKKVGMKVGLTSLTFVKPTNLLVNITNCFVG
jgi:hypothetical protein